GVGCGRATCAPNCGCPRFLEIWNLVFVQYNQDETGRRTPLPRPSIDTGMGLERITAAVAGKTSVYETDIFAPLLGRIGTLSGRQYGAGGEGDRAMRVVAEHSRGLAFLIADGVIPGNEGRGYVLRRLLRRAALFGRRLGLDKPFLAESARTTIEQMRPLYPELAQRQEFIVKAIELEEARFGETLSAGLELMDSLMARQGGEIAGADAFRLYDTYGFPVELTAEIAAGQGFTVDMAGFEKEMAGQRERGRAAHRFGGAVAGAAGLADNLNGRQTAFVGYDRLEHQSVITDLLVDGHPAATVVKGQEARLVLAATPFYGEMGGQAGDTGRIEASSGSFTVSDTVRLPPGTIGHRGYVAEGSLAVGDSVAAVVDGERRQDIARNHTATHLLQAALRQVLGEHVQQRGSLVAPERLRFDFSHLAAMTVEEIQAVQHIVNEKIRQNLAVGSRQLPYKEALAAGALAFFEEQYGDEVRVLSVGTPPVSVELCGGTHVGATGDIGFCCIVSESGIGAGLRRIEAVTGRGAEAYIDQRLAELGRLATALEAKPEEVVARAQALLAELREERRQRLALEREMGRITADSLLERGETVDGVRVIAARVPSARIEALREMSDRLREQLGSGIVVLGSVYDGKPVFLAAVTPDLVGRGYHAGEIVRQVARVAGGGGGGKAELAQAGGKDKDKLDEAPRLVPSLVRGRA
ncbi:MAG: alanine--tRNA ligase, partial [Chloroflexota bacterium]